MKKILDFIEICTVTHHGKFDYSLVNFERMSDKIDIICPHHGVFTQTASRHKSGSGCKMCSLEKLWDKSRNTTSKFIDDSKSVHGDLYDYNLVDYVNNYTPVRIICQEHGEFEQLPTNHVDQNTRCPKCRSEELGNLKRLTRDDFIARCNLNHGFRYDYTNVNYFRGTDKIVINCSIHGDFEQQATSHLSGSGCPKCSNNGYDITKNSYLYIHEILDGDTIIGYKFGITNRTVDARIREIRAYTNYTVNNVYSLYSDGYTILNMENAIKGKYSHGVIDKSFMGHGFTETLSVADGEQLLEEIYNAV